MEQFAEAINKLLNMVEGLQRELSSLNVQRNVDKERIIQLQNDLAKARAQKAVEGAGGQPTTAVSRH